MVKQRGVLFFFIVGLLLIGLIMFFSPSLDISFSPSSSLSIIRILPDSYVKGEAFEVKLVVEIYEDLPEGTTIVVGELVENSEIIPDNSLVGGSIIDNDLIAWMELTPENQTLTYSLVSNANSLVFVGKWGYDSYEEIIGGETIITSSGVSTGNVLGGSGGSGGGGTLDLYDLNEEENNSNTFEENEEVIPKSFDFGESVESQTSNGSWYNNLNWKLIIISLGVLIIFTILIIFFIHKRRKQQYSELMFKY